MREASPRTRPSSLRKSRMGRTRKPRGPRQEGWRPWTTLPADRTGWHPQNTARPLQRDTLCSSVRGRHVSANKERLKSYKSCFSYRERIQLAIDSEKLPGKRFRVWKWAYVCWPTRQRRDYRVNENILWTGREWTLYSKIVGHAEAAPERNWQLSRIKRLRFKWRKVTNR